MNQIRIAKGNLTDRIYAGRVSKDGRRWLSKIDVTDDVLTAVIDRFAGYEEDITRSDGKRFLITVTEITGKAEVGE